MNIVLRKLAIGMAIIAVLTSNPLPAQRVRIIQGPEIEISKTFLTIIRWTSDNPGGSPEHYGVVRYGTDPKDLRESAKSPIRLNPAHASTVFRVRLDNLKPGTTYYYTVGSIEANGTDDATVSSVRKFTTPQ
jgi:Purple acid Phosphatase, N-terminal domain